MHKIGPIAADLSDEMVLHTNDAFIEANWVNAAGLYGDALLQLDYAAQKWHATDVNSGNQLWTSPVWFEPSIPPATDGERFFVFVNDAPTAEFGIVALDLETGARLWHVPDPIALGGESGGQGPIVANGMVYMHDGVQTFYAIEIESGDIAWQVPLGNEIAPYTTLYGVSEVMPNFVADSQYLYTLTGGQFLTALNLADGSVAWSQEIAARPETGTPQTNLSVSNDTLYVTSTAFSVEFFTPTDEYHYYDPFFAAYDAITGQEKERTNLASPAISAPTVVNDRVLLVDAEGIHSYRVDDWSNRIDLDVGPGIDGKGVVATAGSRAFVVGRSGTDIIVVETDGSNIVRTWSAPAGDVAGYCDVDRVHAWANGLMVETTFSQLFSIAPATQSTPEAATPEASPSTLTVESPDANFIDGSNFGPISPNLSEMPEL
jgi:outer membrane protein assembly factor BamB